MQIENFGRIWIHYIDVIGQLLSQVDKVQNIYITNHLYVGGFFSL
jgi:hypothetical protein